MLASTEFTGGQRAVGISAGEEEEEEEGLHSNSQAEGAKTGTSYVSATSLKQNKCHLGDGTETSRHANLGPPVRRQRKHSEEHREVRQERNSSKKQTKKGYCWSELKSCMAHTQKNRHFDLKTKASSC